MIENTSGLVLRTRLLTETSLIVHWLTPDLGRLATVAKGARRPKSPFRGKLDLFYLADLSLSRSARSELHALREVSVRQTHSALRQELGYLQQASYCAALIEQATETETPLPGLFELMSGLLSFLPAQPPLPQTLFAFELKLLDQLGLRPASELIVESGGLIAQKTSSHPLSTTNSSETPHLTAGTRQLMKALLEGDWPLCARVKPSEAQLTEMGRFLHGYVIYHLGREPRGRAAALGK